MCTQAGGGHEWSYWIKSICCITRLASQTGPEKGTVVVSLYVGA